MPVQSWLRSFIRVGHHVIFGSVGLGDPCVASAADWNLYPPLGNSDAFSYLAKRKLAFSATVQTLLKAGVSALGARLGNR